MGLKVGYITTGIEMKLKRQIMNLPSPNAKVWLPTDASIHIKTMPIRSPPNPQNQLRSSISRRNRKLAAYLSIRAKRYILPRPPSTATTSSMITKIPGRNSVPAGIEDTANGCRMRSFARIPTMTSVRPTCTSRIDGGKAVIRTLGGSSVKPTTIMIVTSTNPRR